MDEGLNELIWESKKTSSEGNYGDSSEGNYGDSPLRNTLSLSQAVINIIATCRHSSSLFCLGPQEGLKCLPHWGQACLWAMQREWERSVSLPDDGIKKLVCDLQVALWLPRWLWNHELIRRNCRWKQQLRSLSGRLHWRIAWIHSRLLFEQKIGGCCKAVHGWWYIPKTIKMAHSIFCPTCSSSVWIFHSPARRWTLFPFTFDLGGRSDAGWPLSLGQKRSEREALLEHPLLFACALTESSHHRAQAPQRVHMQVLLSRVPASLSSPLPGTKHVSGEASRWF